MRYLLAILATLSAATAHASDPVLAVLYVDNHSGDATWDVLEKGLADMLVTDLAGQGLTVVERAKLQALIDEQSLQKTAFFDPKTAVKIGHGLGATHVVMGALAAMKPEVRLDLRLVEVATSKIVVTAAVSGPGEALFELEQQLVAKFVAAFERKFAEAPMPQTRVRDVTALLEYSRGLDLADKGELEAARTKIEQTIKLSPSFGLARKKKEELVQRLEASHERRDLLIAEQRAALAQGAEQALVPGTAVDTARLAWRDLEVQLLALDVMGLMSDTPFGVAALGKDKELRAAMTAWATSAAAFVAELDQVLAQKPGAFWRAQLPDEDDKRAKAVGFDTSVGVDPTDARMRVARFVLMGELRTPGPIGHVTVAPPLGNLDGTWDARAWKLLAEAEALASKAPNDYPTIQVLEFWGDALLFRNKTDEAVAKWQEVLDRYPTSQQFGRIEGDIERVLGVSQDSTTRGLASWARGLQTCDDMSFRVGIDTVVYRRMRMTGLQALDDTVAEVEKACRGNKAADQTWHYLYSWTARAFGKHLRCKEFEAWMARSLAAGESPGDVIGWRRNWTKCPDPTP